MIHDYYLKLRLEPDKEDRIIVFDEWRKENQRRLQKNSEEEKYKLWLEEVFAKPLAEIKRESQNKLKEGKNTEDFYPNPDDLQNFPENSALIKISFTLKKPYTSKDEGEFHIIYGRIFENPIVRDKFTGIPMVRPSTWKGHLRFAADRAEWKEEEKKKEIIKRLFGTESEDEKALKGRLYFFPTFFKNEAERDVITPLKRDTRTPARGPINLEVMKLGSKGEFYLLYMLYPRGNGFKEEQIKEDLDFIAEALKLMFYTYGFSAKKTYGFGVIEEELDEGKIRIKFNMEIKEETFSQLNELENKLTKLLGDKYE